MKKYLSISNTLILISLIFTILKYIFPWIIIFGINNYFYNKWDYLIYFIQFFTWTFLHEWVLHFFMNSFFVWFFGNQLETYIWRKKYLIFFITTTIFLWLLITNLTNWNTIWISWFAMALLTYYTLILYKIWNPEYKWGITAIILNIWIWIVPWISLTWHLWWSIYWIIFYLITKNNKKYL